MNKQFEQIKQLHNLMWPERAKADKIQTRMVISQYVEELGELTKAIRNYFGRTYSPEKKGNIDQVKDEMGDCLGMLYALMVQFDTTPEECCAILVSKLARLYNEHQLQKQLDRLCEEHDRYLEERLESPNATNS